MWSEKGLEAHLGNLGFCELTATLRDEPAINEAAARLQYLFDLLKPRPRRPVTVFVLCRHEGSECTLVFDPLSGRIWHIAVHMPILSDAPFCFSSASPSAIM